MFLLSHYLSTQHAIKSHNIYNIYFQKENLNEYKIKLHTTILIILNIKYKKMEVLNYN